MSGDANTNVAVIGGYDGSIGSTTVNRASPGIRQGGCALLPPS